MIINTTDILLSIIGLMLFLRLWRDSVLHTKYKIRISIREEVKYQKIFYFLFLELYKKEINQEEYFFERIILKLKIK